MDFHEHLMFPRLQVADRDDLLAKLGQAVIDAGLARDGYVTALQDREREYPTGLPISGGVAIPHTSAEYVTSNTIVAASLAEPVTFAEMGGDSDAQVPVSTVFLLVFADSAQHVPLLSKLIRSIQKESFVHAVHDAHDAAAMAAVLSDVFPA